MAFDPSTARLLDDSKPSGKFDPSTATLMPEPPEQDGAWTRGSTQAKASAAITSGLATGDTAGVARRIAELDAYRRANPGTPEGNELMAAWEKGDGITGGIKEVAGEFAKDWRDAPGLIGSLRATGKNLSAMGGGIVEQVPNMIAPMGLMLAGGAAGLATPVPGGALVGGFAGATAGNTLMEGGEQVNRALQKAGINPQDTQAVQAFLAENGDKILGQAAVKGGIIGAVDTATMRLGHGILSGPANAAADRALAAMGVNVADKAAVKAARELPEFAARVASDATLQAQKSGAQGLARNATVAGLEPAGEFTGEYFGQGVATGDYDSKGAFLEAASSLGQSAATFAGQKAYEAVTNPARNAPAVDPNAGPLSRAAATAQQTGAAQSEQARQAAQQATDPAARFAELDAKAKGTPDRTVMGSDGKPLTIPGQKAQFLSHEEAAEYRQLLAQRAAQTEQAGLSAEAFRQQPDVPPAGSFGQMNEFADLLAQERADLDQRRNPPPFEEMKGVEAGFDPMSRARNQVPPASGSFGAMNEFADLLGQEQADVQQRRDAIAQTQGLQRDSRLESIGNEIDANRQQQTAESRRSLLDQLDADPETVNLLPRFESMLKKQGYAQRRATPEERELIARRMDARAALVNADQEPVAPNELDAAAMGIRERQPKVRQPDPQPKRDFPIVTLEGAQRRADVKTQETGTPHEVVPHPTIAGRFAVQPIPVSSGNTPGKFPASPGSETQAQQGFAAQPPVSDPVSSGLTGGNVAAANTSPERVAQTPEIEHEQPTNALLNSGEIGTQNEVNAAPNASVGVSQAELERIDFEERHGKPALRERIASGRTPLYEVVDGEHYAKASSRAVEGNGSGYMVKLNLTAEEKKSVSRLRADMELADTDAERTEVRNKLNDAMRPAVDRALMERQNLPTSQGTANEKAPQALPSTQERGTAQQAEVTSVGTGPEGFEPSSTTGKGSRSAVAPDSSSLRTANDPAAFELQARQENGPPVSQSANASFQGLEPPTRVPEGNPSAVKGREQEDAILLTPKQYHEAKMRRMAEDNGVSMSEVRDAYDDEAGRKANEQEWVDAVKAAFRDGKEIPRAALDKLEEVRPGAFNSFLHDHPNAKVPQGYQSPQARQIERQNADVLRADRVAARQQRKEEAANAAQPQPLEPQAGQASRPQGAQEGAQEPGQGVGEFVTTRTVYGDTVRVRRADLDGDRALIPMFTADGKPKFKSVHRENLDPDGSKQAAQNAEAGALDDVVTTKDGKAFANKMGARREQNRRGLVESHDIVPGGEVQAGLGGFVLKRKAAPRSDLDTVAERVTEPTHADPGEAPEAATAPVIREAIQKSARNTEFNAKEAKAWLLAEIDKAIANVPPANRDMAADLAQEKARKFKLSDRVAKLGKGTMREKLEKSERDEFDAMKADRIAKTARQIGFVTFDVPGDGKFKVVNTVEAIETFRDKVKASPGFRDNPTVRPNFGTGNAEGPSLDETLKKLGNTPDALQEIGNAIEIARLKKAKDEDKLLDRFREASGGKDYDAWRAEQDAEGDIAAREAGQSATPNSPEPNKEPWQMTYAEYLNTFDADGREWEGLRAAEHRASVQKAVNEGRLSPDSASMMGYPDIANESRRNRAPDKLAQIVEKARGVTSEEIDNSANNDIKATAKELKKLFSGKTLLLKDVAALMQRFGDLLRPFDLGMQIGSAYNSDGQAKYFDTIRNKVAAVIENTYREVLVAQSSTEPRAEQGQQADTGADTATVKDSLTVDTKDDAKRIVSELAESRPFDSYESVRDDALKAVKEQTGKNWSDFDMEHGMFVDDLAQAIHDGQFKGIAKFAASMPVPVSESDLSMDAATRAYNGTSHSPEKRAASQRRSYVREMVDLWRDVSSRTGDPEALARIADEFRETKDGYLSRLNAALAAHSRVMSSMIVGPARFPVESNRKKSEAADKRTQEADDYLKKARARMMKALRGPVDDSPQSVLQQAQANLAAREAAQERMKKANAALRKGDDAALRAMGFSDERIAQLKKPDFAGRTGFANYELTNNNAEIRRLKQRVEELQSRVERAETKDAPQERTIGPGRIVENVADNRVQVFFDGKPDEAIRNALKAAAFRWAPSAGAWQRQLTPQAVDAAERALKPFASDAQFSRDTTATGTTPDAIWSAVESLVGPLRRRRIVVVQSADVLVEQGILQSRDANGAQAFVKDGKAYFIASNIQPGNERAVFLHEVGAHLGLEKILSPLQRSVLLNRIKTWAAQANGSPESRIAQAALRRVEAAGVTGADADAELIAYTVEEAVKAGINPTTDTKGPIGQWFRTLWNAMRTALEKLGLVNASKLTAQDIVDLAHGAANVAMSEEATGGGIQFSDRTDDGTASMRANEVNAEPDDAHAFRVAVEREARQRYAGKPPVPVTVNLTNEVVFVSWASAKHILRDGTPDWKTALAVLHMEQLMATAGKTGTAPDYKGRSDPRAAHFYTADALIDGEPHSVNITVREHSDGHRYYDHIVVNAKPPAGLPESNRSGIKPSIKSPTPPFAGGATSIAEQGEEVKPSDPRIQFSRAASNIAPVWDVPESSKLFNRFDTDSLLYTLQDKHIDTKRVVEAIRKQSGDIADEFNPYLQEELFHGRSAKGVKDFLDGELRPLLTEMSIRKVGMEELEKFLHARHAEERNIQIAKVNPKMPDGGSGMTTQDANDYLAQLDPARKALLDKLAAKIDAINASTRQLLVDAGLEKAETIKAWEGAYKHYVPLQREEVEQGGLGIGQGFSVKGSASKRAMGSDKAVADIIANIAMQRERAIVRAEKNRVSQALYGLSLKAPNPDFWMPINPAEAKAFTPKQQQTVIDELTSMGLDPADAMNFVKEPTQRYIDPRTGLVAERINPVMRSAPNVLATRVNGEDRYVFFNAGDERANRMVHALKNLDADQLGRLLQTSAKFTRWFASVNTQWNPVFGVINLTRDVQGALLNLSTTPIRGQEGKVLANTFSALKGIYTDLRAIRKGGQASSQWAHLWEEFQKEGGQTGYRDMFSNAAQRAEAIQKELKQIGEGKLKAGGRALFNWLSDYNESMENAIRLATYKAAKDQGISNQQAASIAKSITVNFNKKGAIAAQAGALYAFYNAASQGTFRMLQTLNGPAGRKIILGGLTLGALQAITLALAGFDDDEPPEFVRERSIIIPTGGGKYIAIPMPLGFHVIPNLSRITTEWAMSGFKHTPQRVSDILSLFADTFNPIGNAGWSMQTLAPTALDPFAALAENKDWTGKPIAREDFNGMKPTPGYTRAKDTASVFSKTIAYWANLATGGTDYKPGIWSPSPDQIDYLFGQFTGGVGREYLKAEQTVSSLLTGEDLPAHKTPLLGRFYGDTTGQSSEANRFYNNIKEVNQHKLEIDGRRKDGGDVIGYMGDNPTSRLAMVTNRFETQVRKLRQARRDALERGEGPERIKALDAQITNVMRQFNVQFDRLDNQ